MHRFVIASEPERKIILETDSFTCLYGAIKDYLVTSKSFSVYRRFKNNQDRYVLVYTKKFKVNDSQIDLYEMERIFSEYDLDLKEFRDCFSKPALRVKHYVCLRGYMKGCGLSV